MIRSKTTNQDKFLLDRVIFQDWVNETFVPEVRRRMDRMNYHGCPYLMLDNCFAHAGEEFEPPRDS
jgi:hypothetical protein